MHMERHSKTHLESESLQPREMGDLKEEGRSLGEEQQW